ncbi:cellular nucleic acid-binding protein, partial [Trifolium medium]|nr:cellular nucleic acid-binding protein [Trifolium medium]
MSYDCPKKLDKCLNYGKTCHKAEVCRTRVFCFNCGEEGHKTVTCKKPKKAMGKVFALSGEDASQEDNLIR